jgi:transcription antitermination factor NusG
MSHLRQREVHSYCPMFLEPPWSPRKTNGPVPLFTSYIFVCMAPQVQLNAVAYCPGVAGPVRFGTRLATVDQDLIEALRRREGERGYVVPPEIEVGIKLGSKVMIMAGPLAGLEGVFRGYVKGQERARVFLEFLRQKTTVEVETDLLTAARA